MILTIYTAIDFHLLPKGCIYSFDNRLPWISMVILVYCEMRESFMVCSSKLTPGSQ